MKKFLIYTKPVFYTLNLCYFITKFIFSIFYFIFIYPFKLMYDLYKFMKQINLYFKIEKYLKKAFELQYKNVDCERNVSPDEVEKHIRDILPKDKDLKISNILRDRGFDFSAFYKGIKLIVSKEKGMYIILLEMNGQSLINVHKKCRSNYRRFDRLWL